MTTVCSPADEPRFGNRSIRFIANTGNNNRYNKNHHGSRDLAQKANAVLARKIVAPQLDLGSLRALAIADGRSAETSVRDMVARAYGAANNEHIEEIRSLISVFELAVKGVEKTIAEISAEMDQTSRYLRVEKEGTPWTRSERIKVWFFICLSALLLGVGINTNATVLLSSGIHGFENPIRAYLFSMIPIGIAAGLKALGSHIRTRDRRRTYIIGVWLIGLVFGLIWAKLFSSTFPGLTQSAADIVRNLTETTNGAGSTGSSGILVFVAILAEAFLASGCWLTAQSISESHELADRHDNPDFTKLQSDQDYWTKTLHEYTQILGRLTGKLQAIEDECRHQVERAVNYFRAALKACDNHRHLDSFLNSD